MTAFLRKSALVLATMAFAATTFGVSAAKAASDTPRIKEVKDVTANSVLLHLKDRDNKSDRMTIDVRVLNVATGKVMHKIFHVKLNDDGNKNVKITGLEKGTSYSFKVRDHKKSGGDFTKYSPARTTVTLK
jgi:hypothetical protein